MPIRNVLVLILDDTPRDTLEFLPALTSHPRAISFPNSALSTPLCAVARATFMTGQNQRNHGVLNNNYVHALQDHRSFATNVQAMGVQTCYVGKYENRDATIRNNNVPPGWSKWRGNNQTPNYQKPVYGSTTGQMLTYQALGTSQYASLVVPAADYPPAGGDTAYETDVTTAAVEDFIATTDEPWLIVAGYGAPHDTFTAEEMSAPRHAALYPDATTEVPHVPTVNEADMSGRPAWMQALPPLDQATLDDYDARRRGQWRALKALDEALDRLLNTVVDLDDTLVLIFGDNSTYWGEHRLSGKTGPHEEAVAMFLHAFHPDVTAGRVEEACASSLDIAPTICTAFGAPVPWKPDGLNLLPVITDGEPAGWRQESPIEWSGVEPTIVPRYVGLRTPTHKYVEYPDTGEVEFYDLIADPYEQDNLAGVAQHALTQAALARRLDRYR